MSGSSLAEHYSLHWQGVAPFISIAGRPWPLQDNKATWHALPVLDAINCSNMAVFGAKAYLYHRSMVLHSVQLQYVSQRLRLFFLADHYFPTFFPLRIGHTGPRFLFVQPIDHPE